MSAFCEPPITTSKPHASMSSTLLPSPVIASTTKIASDAPTIRAMRSTSCEMPVDDSVACTNTP